jgi:hypothetical protein
MMMMMMMMMMMQLWLMIKQQRLLLMMLQLLLLLTMLKEESRTSLWAFLREQYAEHNTDGVEALIEKLKPLFDDVANLVHLTRKCCVLTDEEVETVCVLCRKVCASHSHF